MTELITTGREVPSASLAEDIAMTLSGVMDNAPDYNVQRFSSRLISAGMNIMESNMRRSMVAEAVYLMRVEGDWRFFINPETGEPFRHWDETHQHIAGIIGIAESTGWYYQKLMRYADEVLDLPEGEFAQLGGITTVSRMVKLSNVNMRDGKHWSETVRPATFEFRKELLKYGNPGDSYATMMKKFFRANVAHDYKDSSAINKPPGELDLLVEESLGKPKIWFAITQGGDIQWNIVYSDERKVEGVLVDTSTLPTPILRRLVGALRINGK
jgi:hypothetical protein